MGLVIISNGASSDPIVLQLALRYSVAKAMRGKHSRCVSASAPQPHH